MLNFISFSLVAFYFSQSYSQSLGLYHGITGEKVKLEASLASVKPGSVVVIGEKHGDPKAQKQQMQILQALRARGLKVSVGLEFISYLHQDALDRFRNNLITEVDFLKEVGWGSPSFDYYREQALFPILAEGEKTLAINASRLMTGKIAKNGLSTLDASELKTFPPDFELGNLGYRKRFASVMPHISNQNMIDNYFAAQSVWDDTMAWQVVRFHSQNPEQVVVIVVGEFHVQYGGGLPERLKKRGIFELTTFSQIDHNDYDNEEELVDALVPSHEYGSRADYVWIF